MVRLSAGEKKKKLIIDVCKKLFYQKGYANTTYEDICKEADIPPGTITYHFKGKSDIAFVIDTEYERENKTYIEKICGDKYTLTEMMVIENFHMWKRIVEVSEIRRFLLDISIERIPDKSSIDVITYFYQCVMQDQSITNITDKELALIASTQKGMSDGLIHAAENAPFEYTYEELARFGIRFFMRQIGIPDNEIEKHIQHGKELFDQLPIDNRYYENFAYDDKYVTPIE